MDLEQIYDKGHHQPDVIAFVAESNALVGTASSLNSTFWDNDQMVWDLI